MGGAFVMCGTGENILSHSNNDQEIAKDMIELIRMAHPGIQSSEIRCTSVDGYRLPGGAHTDVTLRGEINEAEVFVGLGTRKEIIIPDLDLSLREAFEQR